MDTWKCPIVEVCPHGLAIRLVDGTHCRNQFDSDFSQGGHGWKYRWIPKHEIWIDMQINPEERPFLMFHECEEAELMRQGVDYERAHDVAKRMEDKVRREKI